MIVPTLRHPSESWDILVGACSTRLMNIPAFAGLTGGVGVEMKVRMGISV